MLPHECFDVQAGDRLVMEGWAIPQLDGTLQAEGWFVPELGTEEVYRCPSDKIEPYLGVTTTAQDLR